jgi:hypothetical protein
MVRHELQPQSDMHNHGKEPPSLYEAMPRCANGKQKSSVHLSSSVEPRGLQGGGGEE